MYQTIKVLTGTQSSLDKHNLGKSSFLRVNSTVNLSHLPLQQTTVTDDLVKDVSPHVAVHGRERVIQEVNICLGIQGTGQGDALLLTSRQVDALWTDLCLLFIFLYAVQLLDSIVNFIYI